MPGHRTDGAERLVFGEPSCVCAFRQRAHDPAGGDSRKRLAEEYKRYRLLVTQSCAHHWTKPYAMPDWYTGRGVAKGHVQCHMPYSFRPWPETCAVGFGTPSTGCGQTTSPVKVEHGCSGIWWVLGQGWTANFKQLLKYSITKLK